MLMILNLIFLLIGTCISIISGVEQDEPSGAAIGSEQLHAPSLSARFAGDLAYHSIDQNRISRRRGRGLHVSYLDPPVEKAYSSIPIIRIEGIDNDLRVVVPFISAVRKQDLHPVHQVKNSFFIEIFPSFERIIWRMNDQTWISSLDTIGNLPSDNPISHGIAVMRMPPVISSITGIIIPIGAILIIDREPISKCGPWRDWALENQLATETSKKS